MKIFRNIIFIAISITSLVAECQNNLNESTKTTLDNAATLKKRLDSISHEQRAEITHLSIEQIIRLLLMQERLKDSELPKVLENRKKSHQYLQIATDWFEQPKAIQDWVNYLAIHNQMFTAIQQELNQLKLVPQLHDFLKEIGQRIITAFIKTIISLHADQTASKDDISSLIYAYQDYAKLFRNYAQINNPAMTEILNTEGLS